MIRLATFSCNLRLWSEVMDLITVAESLDLPREHLHFKGKPIRFDGALKGRIAEKHYVGFAAQTTNDWLEAENFAAANLQLVA